MADRSSQTRAAADRVQTVTIAPKTGNTSRSSFSFTRTPRHIAVSKAQGGGSPEQFQQIGTSGLRQYGGYVLEEWLRKLQGREGAWVYREMLDNSPIVGAVLFTIEWMMRQIDWPVEAGGDPKAAEFVEENMHDMDCSWGDFVTDALSMLPYGYSFHEIILKRRQGYKTRPTGPGENYADTQEAYWPASSQYTDGKVGWRAFPVRAQETLLRWEFQGYGNVSAFVQIDWHGGYHTIPIEKGLLFRSRPRRGNPMGYSILRPAYTSYYLAKEIQNLEAIGVERDLAGLPQLTPPPGVDLWAPGNEQMLQRAQDFVSSVRRDEMEGLVLPTAEWIFALVNSGGSRQIDTSTIITRLEQRIATSMLADFLLLGQAAVGSFSLASVKADLFGVALNGIADLICEVLNENAVIPLLRLNGFDVTDPPKISHSSATQMDLEKVGMFLYQLSGAGAPIPWSTAIMKRLFDEAELPSNFEEAVKEPIPAAAEVEGDEQPVGPPKLPFGADPFAREAHYEPGDPAAPVAPVPGGKPPKGKQPEPTPVQKADTSETQHGIVHHLAPVLHARQQHLASQLEAEINAALEHLGVEAATAYSHVAVKAGSPEVRNLVNRVMTRLHLKQWVDSKLVPLVRNHSGRVMADTQKLVQQQVGIEVHIGAQDAAQIAATAGTGLGMKDIEPQVRQAIMQAITDGQAKGEHPTKIARRIRGNVPAGRFVNAGPAYRSKLIARTETADLQRKSTLAAYRSNPRIGHVMASDGILADSDAACQARNGEVVPIDEADSLQPMHPACTLSISPVVASASSIREPELAAA